MTCYSDDHIAPAKDVKMTFKNVKNENVEYYLLNEEHDAGLVREEVFSATAFFSYARMPRCGTYLFRIIAL